jgi:transcriptional regulator with XRE-family HTH domain
VERDTGGVSHEHAVRSTVGVVDVRDDIREFLTTRRARLTPDQVGLPDYGTRRVPGLRREEVAVLAGVSVPYYTRLERGDLSGASETVLLAVARALQLDDAECAHLFDLARAARPALAARPRRRRSKRSVRPDLQWLLDTMTGSPAFIRNDRLDVLAANALGRALYSPLLSGATLPVNTARWVFLDPRAQDFYRDWDRSASECVAAMRSAAGRDPFDRDFTDLVGELSTRSDEFRVRWAQHDVRFHDAVVKRLRHPVVGELDLHYNRIVLPSDDGLSLTAYTAEPGSRSEEALRLLGSWAATVGEPGPRTPASRRSATD